MSWKTTPHKFFWLLRVKFTIVHVFNQAPRHESVFCGGTDPFIRDFNASGVFNVAVFFTLDEKLPDTHWTGEWLGPKSGMDFAQKRKLSCAYQVINPNSHFCFILNHRLRSTAFLICLWFV